MAQLPPSEPLAVFQQFIARQNESIELKERVLSLSGDSFSIKTTGGRPLMNVKGKTVSMSGRKIVTDMQGKHPFTIRKKTFNIGSGTYYAEDPQGNKFFVLKGKFSIFGSKDIGTFENSITKQPVSLLMKGNFFNTSADIMNKANDQAVARIQRKRFNAREILANQQTYEVICAAGVDMAIIVAMCICLDEKRNEKKNTAQSFPS